MVDPICGLSEEEAHIHVLVLRKDYPVFLVPPTILDEAEMQRWHRFRRPADRYHYGAAHELLRRTLSHYANIPPEDWRFTGAHGARPELIGHCAFTGPRFSLTHSTGIVACAVARTHPIGLDAESVCHADAPMALAEEFFAAEEVTFLRGLPPDELIRAFLQIWTLKEAYLKSLGTGLALALRSFTVSINPPAVEPRGTSSTAWVATSRWISDEHVVSVTVPRGDGECCFKWNICYEPSL